MLQYTALLTDAAGDTLIGLPVSWSTGGKTIATLADFGVNMGITVVGAAAGSTTITATSGAVSGSADVTVTGALPALAFSGLSAGYDHTCALTTDGRAYCRGYNGLGGLGNGTMYASAVTSPAREDRVLPYLSRRWEGRERDPQQRAQK